jgi:hypothetical protein
VGELKGGKRRIFNFFESEPRKTFAAFSFQTPSKIGFLEVLNNS